MAKSPLSRANINATYRASCRTGNRHTAPGPVTIYELNGADYTVETASQRHVRETSVKLAAERAASGYVPPAVAAQAPALPVTPAKAKRKPRSANLTAPSASRSTRTPAQKARDARYQWLKRRLAKLGSFYTQRNTLPGRTLAAVRISNYTYGATAGSALAAMEVLWTELVCTDKVAA